MVPAISPRFSLIVPAYNEEHYLPRLLDSVERAKGSYPGGGQAIEVVVADNASTDATAAVAERRGCRVVRVETRVIAAARNGGAAVARGAVLAFVDADSALHPGTFQAIDRALASGRCVAGATGVRMERWSLGIAATYALIVPLVVLMRMDTGVVFCRREDFEAVAGYDEARLFAEDVAFLFALRRRGRERGERLVRLRGVKALGSTRKWDEHGEWHYLAQMLRVGWRMMRSPTAAADFARRYWYGDGRRPPPRG